MKKLVILSFISIFISNFFISCDLFKEEDDCPAGTHLYYTRGGTTYEYSSDSECGERAYSDGYRYYCYDGKCHAYNTKY